MSLKAFHIVFIVFAVALMAFFAAWSLRAYARSGQYGELTLGVIAIAAGAGLLVYGVWFLRKIKHAKLS